MAIKTVQATINGQTYTLTLNSTSGKYEATVTAPSKSSYNQSGHYYGVTVKATDVAGNITTKDAAATSSTSFKVDTVPPVLTLSSPTDKLVTNQSACTVKGTTNDATSSPVTVTVKLNSGAAEAVTVGSDGSFSKALTLAEGTNTIIVVAKDGAGKTTTVTRTVTLNTVAPTIKSVTITPNPVDCGKTFVISVEVTN